MRETRTQKSSKYIQKASQPASSRPSVLTSVYLVAIAGYSPLMAFVAKLVEPVVAIVTQPFVGDVVDRVKIHKYTILVISAFLKITAGLCMVYSTNFGVVCFKFALDGLVESSFLSSETALMLGVVGKTRFHKKSAAQQNMLKFSGHALGTMIFGFVSYAVWPNVNDMYWTIVIGGVLQLICLFLMTRDGEDAVDHNTARGISTRMLLQKSLCRIGYVQKLGDVDINSGMLVWAYSLDHRVVSITESPFTKR